MAEKIYIPAGEAEPVSHIGATLEALFSTIVERRDAGEESYTYRLLTSDETLVWEKISEEATEVVEAAGEGDVDHLRYEAGDLLYHLLVVLARHEIPLDELAAELNMRMKGEERPCGGAHLFEEFIQRGK